MGQRDKWEFEYTAAKLAEAAEAKREHHVGRLDWWQAKRAEVIQRIKDSGMDVRESLAVSKSPGYGQAQIVIDSTMQKDLGEAVSKVEEHEDRVRGYDGWVQVLRANPEARLKLHHDDYLFFFGE